LQAIYYKFKAISPWRCRPAGDSSPAVMPIARHASFAGKHLQIQADFPLEEPACRRCAAQVLSCLVVEIPVTPALC
jgi:hypothetical protein